MSWPCSTKLLLVCYPPPQDRSPGQRQVPAVIEELLKKGPGREQVVENTDFHSFKARYSEI